MANDTSVIVPIEADNRPLKQTLSDTTSAIEKESQKWDKDTQSAAGSMDSKMTSMFKKISAAAIAAKVGQTLLEWGKDAIAAASDLEEVQNVVDVTFGESASQIDAWAKQAITQFGLTETKAKQFASTLGAMMKSAGMAGPEIVQMSEDLAGLAADMSSFYNMDFDTAFQKIRSGISGETEPLKQLGINMSVANLEAFALQQGITKTFDKMSQGEQTLLRYQYLMQATADAQGDFARTSDGYANGLRLLESNIDSIKTRLGQILVPALAEATEGLNDFLGSLTQERPQTVLDQFNQIDLDTESKLAQVKATADEANDLIAVLQKINETTINEAKSGNLVAFVESFAGNISGLDKALKAAKDGDMTGTIEALAEALSTELGGDPAQWRTLLTAVSANLPGATNATLNDKEQTAAWLKAAAAAADDLGGDYSKLWGDLLKALGDNAGAAVAAFADASDTGSIMEAIAKGANVLDSGSPRVWRSLLTALTSVNGLEKVFGKSDAGKNVEELAKALSGNSPDTTKAEAWQTFLSALNENADALTALTGTSAEETKKWLADIADAAGKLSPESAGAWDTLLGYLVKGLPGLDDTEGGKAFFEALTTNFLAMGNESEQAKAGLQALGLSTEQIDEKQAQWLETCKRLVQTIPGLSEIINTQTGEVQGGTEAIEEHVKAWQEAQEKIILWEAYYAKESALLNGETQLGSLKLDVIGAEQAAKKAKQQLDEIRERMGLNEDFTIKIDRSSRVFSQQDIKEYNAALDNWQQKEKEAEQAQRALTKAEEEQAEATEKLQNMNDGLTEKYGEVETAAQDAGDAINTAFDDTTAAAAVKDVEAAQKALQALTDYTQKAYESTRQSLTSALGGFSKMVTPAEEARNKIKDVKNEIAALQKAGKDTKELTLKMSGYDEAIPTIQNITAALKTQIDYLDEYQKNLDAMKRAGFSADVLAMVSDGSAQSADYAAALAGANKAQVDEINKQVSTVRSKTDELSTALTENKLAVDETAQGLVDDWTAALEQLNQYDGAKENAAATMQGIIDGLGENAASVRAQVDSISSMLSELSGASYGLNIPGVQFNSTVGGGQTVQVHTSINLDGTKLGEAVSQHQADALTQLQRGGSVKR